MLISWLLLVGCLERVTGASVPLDPRFTVQAAGPVSGGGDTGAAAHGTVAHQDIQHKEVGPPKPFADVEGPKVIVRGTVVAERSDLSVDVDVSRPDKSKPGGLDNAGKLMLPTPGPFELPVPSGVGVIVLNAFQDPDLDGPSDSDPFAAMTLEIGDTDPDPVTLTLREGARTEGPSHVQAPPGAGSGQAPPPVGTQAQESLFAGATGTMVSVSVELIWSGEQTIDVDLFTPDVDQPGGRRFLGKLKKQSGPFTIDVPLEYEIVEIEAFVDLDGDGPSPTDPTARGGEVSLSDEVVRAVVLTLAMDAEAPASVPEVGPGQSLEQAFEGVRAGQKTRKRGPDGI